MVYINPLGDDILMMDQVNASCKHYGMLEKKTDPVGIGPIGGGGLIEDLDLSEYIK